MSSVSCVLKEEWRYWLTGLLLASLPYVWSLWRAPYGGWDIPFYINHLGRTPLTEYHTFIEPLYFWLFKPLTYLFEPLTVVHISQMVMLWVLLFGFYLLARRFDFPPTAALLGVVILAYTPGVARLWWDTLRNFLAFALVPYFVYLVYGARYKLAAALLALSLLAHRMTLVMIPLFVFYLWAEGRLKDRGRRMVFISAAALLGLSLFMEPMHYIGVPLSMITFLWTEPLQYFTYNVGLINAFINMVFLLAVFGVLKIDWDNPKHRFILIHFLVFLAATVFLNAPSAGRLVLYLAFPAVMLALVYYVNIRRGDPITRNMFIGIVALLILVQLPAMHNVQGTMAQPEADFIEAIDIPEGSVLIAPSRLNAYVNYAWAGTHDVKDVEYYGYWYYPERHYSEATPVYYGDNPFNQTVYFLDGDHWAYNKTLPLALYKMDAEGRRSKVAAVRYAPAGGAA